MWLTPDQLVLQDAMRNVFTPAIDPSPKRTVELSQVIQNVLNSWQCINFSEWKYTKSSSIWNRCILVAFPLDIPILTSKAHSLSSWKEILAYWQDLSWKTTVSFGKIQEGEIDFHTFSDVEYFSFSAIQKGKRINTIQEV